MVEEILTCPRGGTLSALFARSRDYISLCKPRILLLLVAVAAATAIVVGPPEVRWDRVALVALAGGLASASASTANNLIDRDLDAVMDRTRHRPLAAKRVPAKNALILAIALLVVGVGVSLLLGHLTAAFVTAGALIYSLVYTLWLKRRSPLNIVVGGLAGSCAVLAGWAAVTTTLSAAPFIIAFILFVWTPSHFWSFALVHQENYRKGGVPMLPLVASRGTTVFYIILHTVVLVSASIVLYLFSELGPVYLAGAIVFGVPFLGLSFLLWRDSRGKASWAGYKFSGIYLAGLLASMLIDLLSRRVL